MKVLFITLFTFLIHAAGISNGASLTFGAMSEERADQSVILIDSSDHVIIDLDRLTYDGEYIEVPVYIESDEVINTLDFSFLVNVANLEFDSVVDHTGDLQYAAFLNPNDLKLRFTSNSFSSYPVLPEQVVSLRFRMLSGIVHKSDFQMIVSYLNGEKCTNHLAAIADDILLASEEGEVSAIQVYPNPATDMLFIVTEQESKADLYNAGGMLVLHQYPLHPQGSNTIPVDQLPRGMYTLKISNSKHTLKLLQVILQ